MILFPAIDLKDGKCVRLRKGDMDDATVYNDDPVAQALSFVEQGFSWLHLVDLNGAVEGHLVNGPAVEAILHSVDIPIQLGGGIRTMAGIDTWLGRGVHRVILGTAALEDPALIREACLKHPDRIVVGIDARNGKVATDGWTKTSTVDATALAKQYADYAVAAIVYTDIDRDGVLAGPNIEETAALARAVEIPVIASGGVSSLDDLKALQDADAPIAGVISGRAIYDGRLDPEAALALLSNGD